MGPAERDVSEDNMIGDEDSAVHALKFMALISYLSEVTHYCGRISDLQNDVFQLANSSCTWCWPYWRSRTLDSLANNFTGTTATFVRDENDPRKMTVG